MPWSCSCSFHICGEVQRLPIYGCCFCLLLVDCSYLPCNATYRSTCRNVAYIHTRCSPASAIRPTSVPKGRRNKEEKEQLLIVDLHPFGRLSERSKTGVPGNDVIT